ncbi:YhdP family protein [Aliikangiella maris]|uniref:DUF3971 domain-containing protein n=1 Tax=Aliikangiella maris TaxID=3162458 RepID=A0ABV2BS21_9GAMM
MTEPRNNSYLKILVFVVNKLWLLLATSIILVALCFALLHLLLPQIGSFQTDIEQWIESKYQVDIEAESISAEWRSNGPVFAVNQLKVQSNTGQFSLLAIDSMRIHFDGLGSLLSQSVTTEKIEVSGANLSFVIDRKLGVQLDSLEEQDTANNQEVKEISRLLLVNLFNQKNLTLLSSDIRIETLTGKEFNYTIEKLDISNHRDNLSKQDIHQLTGKLLDKFNGELKLVAEIYGDPATPQSHTDFYLEGRNIALSHLPGYVENSHYKPYSGVANWKLWSHWRDGHWQNADGLIELNNVRWRAVTEQQTDNELKASIEKFSLDFNWHFTGANTGVLSFYNADLKVFEKDPQVLPTFYFLFNEKNARDIQWDLVIHDFNTRELADFYNLILDVDKNKLDLSQRKLAINLDSLGMRIERKQGRWEKIFAYSTFSDLQYDKQFGVPQINGISGSLLFANGEGQTILKGEQLTADFNGLFRQPLHLDSLDMSLLWRIDETGQLDLYIDSAYLKNSDLTVNARSHFFYQDELPNLNLYAELTELDASQTSRYLPVQIMSEPLVNYLDRSVKSGKVSLAKAMMHGPLKAFPFDNTEGLFSIRAQLENAEFEYLPRWPLAQNMRADLLFEGNGMDLRSNYATSEQVTLNAARAVIKDYAASGTPLELFIDASTVDNHGREFLLNSSLTHIGQALQSFDYQGKINAQIGLTVELDSEQITHLDGKVKPDKNSAKIAFGDFQFSQLDGLLLLDNHGIRPSELAAQYHQRPINVHLQSGQKDSEPELIIKAKGALNAQALTDIVAPHWADLAEGETLVEANIAVAPPAAKDKVILNFKTDLQGLQLKLPEPFLSVQQQKSPLSVSVQLASMNSVQINWNKLRAKWWWKSQPESLNHDPSSQIAPKITVSSPELEKQTNEQSPNERQINNQSTSRLINENQNHENQNHENQNHENQNHENQNHENQNHQNHQNQKGRSESRGAQINGYQHVGGVFLWNSEFLLPDLPVQKNQADLHFDSFDFQQWLPVFKRIHQEIQQSNGESEAHNDFRVTINQFNHELFKLDEVKLIGSNNQTEWLFNASGPDLTAQLKLLSDKPWALTIDNLNLDLNPELFATPGEDQSATENEVVTNASPFTSPQYDLQDWPSMDIHCKQCQIHQKKLGEIQINLVSSQDGLNVQGRVQDEQNHQLKFNANWLQIKASQVSEQSHTDVQMLNLTHLEYELATNKFGQLMQRWNYPVPVADSSGRFAGRLWWRDLPWRFSTTEFEGDVRFELGAGYLSEVSDAKARLFSLFSLQTLSRRLQLDFSDVYKKGFFYDQLSGNIRMRDGVAVADNIYVDGNAAKVTLSGSVNLKDQVIEQRALVVPQLTSSLPVLVGWAVEPTTGIIVYLLNKLFEPAIEVVTQIEYRIHGPISDMSIDEIKKFKDKVKYKTSENALPAKSQNQTAIENQSASESQSPDKVSDVISPGVDGV